MSRFHCRLEINPPHGRLIDLDSRNGTFVNGARITQASLQDGDVVEVGSRELTVSITGSDAALQPTEPATLLVEDVPLVEIPGYEVCRQLGRGPAGVVYQAVHRDSGRIIALKLLNPDANSDAEGLQHFLSAASALTGLRHRRIVQSLEFGVHDRQPYLVREYVETIDLDEIMASASPTSRIRLACGVVCQALEGLQHAHEQGIVHNNLKPSNLLAYRAAHRISSKLVDFGRAIGCFAAGFSMEEGVDAAAEALAYRPPELILDSSNGSPAGDVYSAGACLYRYLTGHTPHEFSPEGDPQLVILDGGPVPIGIRVPTLPEPLVRCVERSLARVPDRRFASAEAMRDTLLPYARRREAV